MISEVLLELCPVCGGDAATEGEDCVWCEGSEVPGFVEHDCD